MRGNKKKLAVAISLALAALKVMAAEESGLGGTDSYWSL